MASMFGADAVLYKPFSNEEFLDAVERLLVAADSVSAQAS
ncbi:hypothetical protein CCP2SC5_170004 [Azospirillaceae bacterium]